MKPCTSINLFYDPEYVVPVEEQMRRVADAGFAHLDMNFWDWSIGERSPFCKPDWHEWVKGIDAAAQRMGVVFTQAHAHVANFYRQTENDPNEEQILRSIEGAGMLRIPWIVMHTSQRADWDQPGSYETMMRENVEYFRRHAEYAAKFGTGLALENVPAPAGGLVSAEQLCDLVDRIDMPNVGICWDTGHANLGKQDQPAAIRTMAGKLHALHIADNKGEKDDHTIPYLGMIDWTPIVEALKETGYDGDFTYEAHMFVRGMPDYCKADALKLQYRIAELLVNY